MNSVQNTFDSAKQLAKEKNGKLLSDNWVSYTSPYRWECENKHQWTMTYHSIKKGLWCPHCAGKKKIYRTIEDLNLIAAERGGKCISLSYPKDSKKEKITWECKEKHIWQATIGDIIYNKTWCPYCAGNKSLTYEDAKTIALKYGGKCISTSFVNARSKLVWECIDKHRWSTSLRSVRAGHWCPTCKESFGERYCRVVIEELLGVNFDKLRPNWLIDDNGKKLELDGYNESLGIAFEHQGVHHYEKWHHHKSDKDYTNQLKRDQIKRAKCKENKVLLIEIPEVPRLMPFDGLQDFLIQIFDKNNIKYKKIKSNESSLIEKARNKSKLEDIEKIIEAKGGKIISYAMNGSRQLVEIECSDKHRWEVVEYSLKAGYWCPKCARNAKLDISEAKKLAELKGGKCLDDVYINNQVKMRWECGSGHRWAASLVGIKSGTWCPVCAHTIKGTIEEMNRLALSRNGKCLSDKYLNANTKLTWQCEYGHIWSTKPSHIKSGHWCPTCAIEFVVRTRKPRSDKAI